MAHNLVTQVRNPDANDPIELEQTGVVVDPKATEDKKATPPAQSTSLWSCIKKCFTCTPCSTTGQTEDKDEFVYVPPGGKQRLGRYLLPKRRPDDRRKTLVLDLDETLVHSSFKPVPNADFVISIELENEIHHVFVLKRPGVDEFIRKVSEKYEVVVFTASLAKYADPLLDMLDPQRLMKARLFREACVQHYGNYVKDLSRLGRDLSQTLIIDNSPYSYIFQPDNAIPISSWFSDQNDRQLYEIIPILDTLLDVDDVCAALASKDIQLPQGDPSQG